MDPLPRPPVVPQDTQLLLSHRVLLFLNVPHPSSPHQAGWRLNEQGGANLEVTYFFKNVPKLRDRFKKMTFDELMIQWNWKPIRNCPGRFVLSGVRSDLPPENVVGPEAELFEFDVEAARDKVLVSRLDEGGLISYKRADGTYLHTLNSADGFSRKMLQLKIVL